MKEPCIVARELMDSRVFENAIGIEHHAREVHEAAVNKRRSEAFPIIEHSLSNLVRAAIERAIEEDRKTR